MLQQQPSLNRSDLYIFEVGAGVALGATDKIQVKIEKQTATEM